MGTGVEELVAEPIAETVLPGVFADAGVNLAAEDASIGAASAANAAGTDSIAAMSAAENSIYSAAAGGVTGAAAAGGGGTGGLPTEPTVGDLPTDPNAGSVDWRSGLETARTVATVLSPIASLASAASGVSAARRAGQLGSLGGVPQPQVAAPVTMPTAGGTQGQGGGQADTLNTMRANIQEQLTRRGRAATILTDPGGGERLGS